LENLSVSDRWNPARPVGRIEWVGTATRLYGVDSVGHVYEFGARPGADCRVTWYYVRSALTPLVQVVGILAALGLAATIALELIGGLR
jgi:hypothetical protein